MSHAFTFLVRSIPSSASVHPAFVATGACRVRNPVAITTGGGALISVFVTSAQIAHLLRTALQVLAGGAAPRNVGVWEEDDPWMS
jgi:hypothetical protein